MARSSPTELVDFLDYALLRAADGATKSSLKSLFSSFSFLEEVAGIEEPKRVTSSSLFTSAKKELLLARRVVLGQVERFVLEQRRQDRRFDGPRRRKPSRGPAPEQDHRPGQASKRSELW